MATGSGKEAENYRDLNKVSEIGSREEERMKSERGWGHSGDPVGYLKSLCLLLKISRNPWKGEITRLPFQIEYRVRKEGGVDGVGHWKVYHGLDRNKSRHTIRW